jgi:iron-sulfur cluster repair protein YtfE (RIC family)
MYENLFEELRADHRDVSSLFLRLQEAGEERDRTELLDRLLKIILAHMIGEEQIVYPALRPDAAAWEDARRAMDEHRRLQEDLRRLRDLPPGGEEFRRRLGVAREEMEMHFRQEEEKVFADLRRVISERHAGRVLDSFRREKALAARRYPDLPLPTTGAGEIRV